MKVKMSELKQICEKLLTEAEQIGLGEIDLPNDYYWLVLSPEREDFSIGIDSTKIGVGSLSDDMQGLHQFLNGDYPPTINDFERIGNVFIAAAEAVHRLRQIP